jgi:RNA polymerase sigma-70 factor (ECF subfamily)
VLAPEPDARLVHAARSGDRATFSMLYSRFAPMVHAVLLARVRPADADDLVQEVFLQALRKLDTLADPSAIGPWLAAIARNAAAALHRSRRPAPDLPDAADPRAPIGARAEADEALAAIRSLPEAYRETLLMRLIEGLSGPEIAARTGLTPGSVRVNLHRGMALLRQRLGAPTRS